MKIIDAHQHLWDLDRFRYSWTAAQPKLNRSFLMPDYLAATAGIEVVQSVHVEADVDEAFMRAETDWISSLAERDDNPLSALVAVARPESDDFQEFVAGLAANPRVKGIRRLLQSEPDELSTTTTFVENIRSLADWGLSFDLCVRARQLPLAARLIRECPDVQFILDHCGNPDIQARDYDSWRAELREIANLPNVVCKVSGIVVNADRDRWTADDLRPAVQHVIACFGWDRVLFGSDWPVCTLAASYRQWLDALLALTADAGEDNRIKLFQDNAARIYRLYGF
jgi:predicted TIM-barrel fold metal-dependent hydrolase